MFDIGFSELLLIAVMALVVIGPKRLPETVRFTGLWIGRLKRSLTRAYQEMDKELGLDDIRRQLHNEEVMRSIEEHKRRIEAEIRSGTTEPSAADRPTPTTDNDTPAPSTSAAGDADPGATRPANHDEGKSGG